MPLYQQTMAKLNAIAQVNIVISEEMLKQDAGIFNAPGVAAAELSLDAAIAFSVQAKISEGVILASIAARKSAASLMLGGA